MSGRIQKVVFYIDGFNFYYGLKSKWQRKYLWIDMVKFCEQFLRPYQELVEVNYYTAIQLGDSNRIKRQNAFLSVNKMNPKFILHIGRFLKKPIKCKNCKKNFEVYEEKETDVHIACTMIRNVILGKCDISILISADSDLIPPIITIKEINPIHKIFVYFPPNRISGDLKNKSDAGVVFLAAHEDKYKKAMLPNEVTLANGTKLTRPATWV